MNPSLQNAQASDMRSRVVIVGGGLAGLAAAWRLTESGFQVTILEAKNRLGGRAGSFQAHDGESIDYCQHVGMGCCHELIEFIQWLGQSSQWDIHRTLHFYGPDGQHMRLGSLPLPAPAHIAHWLWKWPGLTLKDRLAVGFGILKIRSLDPSDARLDQVRANDWFQDYRQTDNSIHRFWATIIVSALGEEIDRVSIAAVAKVMQDGFLKSRSAYHLLVPRQPLDQLFNQDARRRLEQAGVSFRMGYRVQELRCTDLGIEVVLPQAETLVARHVVVAVPWHQVERIRVADQRMNQSAELHPQHTDAPQNSPSKLAPTPHHSTLCPQADQLSSSPITGIHTWWTQPWLDSPHAVLVGRRCQWVFPKGEHNVAPSAQPVASHYYQIVVSASRNLLDVDARSLTQNEYRQAIESALIQDLAAVFPKLRSSRLQRFQLVTDPHSVFSVGIGTQQIRPQNRTEFPGIWLSGDWTQTGWPATMEGAIRSGTLAAEGIQGETNHP